MKARVTKRFEFEASHRLEGHLAPDGSPGKCSRLHGHSYKLDVTVYREVINSLGSDLGFVIDFYNLGQIVKSRIIDVYDHQNLNDLLPFRTTAELMSFYFFGLLYEDLDVALERVRLWETRTGYAEFNREDFTTEAWEEYRRLGVFGSPFYVW